MKILLAALLCFSGALFAADINYEETFPVSANARLSLDSHKGLIRIRSAAVSQIEVRYRIHLGENNDADADLMEYVNVQVSSGGSYVDLKVDYDNDHRSIWGRSNTTWPYVDFDILVPDDSSLRIDSHKSKFDVETPAGRIDIESHKGYGRISGIRGDANIESHKGNFTIDIDELYDLRIETHKGNLDINIAAAADFSIDGSTHKGDIRVNGRDAVLRTNKKGREGRLNYQEGSGANRIRIDTHKGDVKLNFQQ